MISFTLVPGRIITNSTFRMQFLLKSVQKSYIINNKNLHLKQIVIIEQSIQFLYFELIHGFLLFSFDHRTNVTLSETVLLPSIKNQYMNIVLAINLLLEW
jgi:hypothetical protein